MVGGAVVTIVARKKGVDTAQIGITRVVCTRIGIGTGEQFVNTGVEVTSLHIGCVNA